MTSGMIETSNNQQRMLSPFLAAPAKTIGKRPEGIGGKSS
jgi:hypothetical protein